MKMEAMHKELEVHHEVTHIKALSLGAIIY